MYIHAGKGRRRAKKVNFRFSKPICENKLTEGKKKGNKKGKREGEIELLIKLRLVWSYGRERTRIGDKEKMKHIRETRSFVTYSMSLSLLMLSCSVAIIQEGHNGTERRGR